MTKETEQWAKHSMNWRSGFVAILTLLTLPSLIGCAGQQTGQGTVRETAATVYVENLNVALPPGNENPNSLTLTHWLNVSANKSSTSLTSQPVIRDTRASQTPTSDLSPTIDLTP